MNGPDPMKTYSATPKDIERAWYLVDADGLVLGRLAALVAERLRGKHKAMYTPNLDCGDHIVVVNAEKVALTGNKLGQKTYYRHSGYPGGLKQRTAGQVLAGAHPGAGDREGGAAHAAQGRARPHPAEEAPRLQRPRPPAPGADAGRARRGRPQSQEQHQEELAHG